MLQLLEEEEVEVPVTQDAAAQETNKMDTDETSNAAAPYFW